LQDVEKALEQELKQSSDLEQKSVSLERELIKINAKLIGAAQKVQKHETAVIVLEEKLILLQFEEAEKVKLLAEQRVQFSKVLMALERMARFPPEALIAQPGDPADTVRSAILLRAVVPEIERRAEALRLQIEGLAISREKMKAQRTALTVEADLLERENKQLTVFLQSKKKLKVQTDAESKRVASRANELAKEAESLRDLLMKLSAEQEFGEQSKVETALTVAPAKPELDSQEMVTSSLSVGMLSGIPITKRRGELAFPVVGKVVSRYGQANENGVTERGIKVLTRPSAQVIAPYEGQVAYVGEFRGYGLLLIIEHSEGYHTLLAGMVRIDSVMGQKVLIGEPVGVMGSELDAKPVLYVELRRGGKPINPLSWLAARG